MLATLPNPKGYALHHPTVMVLKTHHGHTSAILLFYSKPLHGAELQFECDDVLENFGEGLLDATHCARSGSSDMNGDFQPVPRH